MDEPFVLVVNPRAGAGAAARRTPALEAALTKRGARFVTRTTASPRDATRIVREVLASGAHAGVAVVGGDGTLSEAVNGFFDEEGAPIAPEAWLAPLPCGTGGDFRRTLGFPKDVDGMVERMLAARPRAIDTGWVRFEGDEGAPDARAFLNIASFGLAGRVVRTVNAGPKWIGGPPAFLLGTFRAMLGYANQRVRVTVDDAAPRELSILNLAVANGRYFGGGMEVAPRALIDDGLFDVVALEMTPVQSLRLTAAIYRGAHLGDARVWHARGSRITAAPARETERVLLEIDGEAPGRLPATFELRPGSLRLRA
ncbi:MAG: diacylglycerol kinase family lipid kinase [Sandaracinaceae bacterium]|nr:diacylglycerol kinase family lipid kinase [Sandaracinaceae bacterium]